MSNKGKTISKWTPSYPIAPKDNIISSQSRANNERGFVPSYENEGKPSMYCLLSHEFMRTWFKERAQYEKEVYTKKEMMKEESKIKRRFVQKNLTPKKREKELPIIKLKRFENVNSKTKSGSKQTEGKEEGEKPQEQVQ